MLFKVLPAGAGAPTDKAGCAYLVRDDWNDWYEFKTMCTLVVVDLDGATHLVGSVKIGRFGMSATPTFPKTLVTTPLDAEFDSLDESYFSLGQSENYYETLNEVSESLRVSILRGLRDVSDDLALFEKAKDERVMRESLLRDVKAETVRRRFSRLAKGDAQLTAYSFAYDFPSKVAEGAPPLSLDFSVTPDSLPPTNIHVLIGRNGVGKTRCLRGMTRALVEQDGPSEEVGVFRSVDGSGGSPFANLVSVSFSAFDIFGPLVPTKEKPHATRYHYVGLSRGPISEDGEQSETPKGVKELADEFLSGAERCSSGARERRWRTALKLLEADPLFKEIDVVSLALGDRGSDWRERAGRHFHRLSSGHKIVLLTITRLVELVDERTLVLLDEPEAHLHPPLLSALVRSLSGLLTQRNGVAIVATHSPVVLQEAPKTCVWILNRSGVVMRAKRPEIETFGENVGVLTREVFGLEVTQTGFHRLLEAAASDKAADYESILARFGHQLGAEARAIASAIVAERDAEEAEDESQEEDA